MQSPNANNNNIIDNNNNDLCDDGGGLMTDNTSYISGSVDDLFDDGGGLMSDNRSGDDSGGELDIDAEYYTTQNPDGHAFGDEYVDGFRLYYEDYDEKKYHDDCIPTNASATQISDYRQQARDAEVAWNQRKEDYPTQHIWDCLKFQTGGSILPNPQIWAWGFGDLTQQGEEFKKLQPFAYHWIQVMQFIFCFLLVLD